MAQLTSIIKSILNGSKSPAPTTGEMKNALGTLYDFVTDILGTDSSNKGVARAALGVPSVAGLRNILINGDFRVNQRLYAAGTASTTANQYCLDRWRIPTSGQAVTWTLQSGVMYVTPPASGIEQVVHQYNNPGGTFCLNWQGTANGYINGTQVAKNTPFTLAPYTTVVVKFQGGTVAQAQLEPEKCLAYEVRPYHLERMLCAAYWQKGIAQSINGLSYVAFPQEMQDIPSNISWTVTGGGVVVLESGWQSQYGFRVSSTFTYVFTWTADAEFH